MPHLQVSPWPANFRAGTYPKYNGSTDLAQYIMSYQVVVASSGGDDATMAKSFIIALEGLALTWYTRLPPLSIDSWRSLRDKFLLNFQGYRPDTDALAELSLCKQMEKETLREYYCKFLTLKSQLPSVDDQIAIQYAISCLRAGVLYSHYIRDPPKNLQELYQLFPKYNGSTDPAQYIMSYQVAVASSGGDDATMAKSFIIALEGPALTWYTRLTPLSIDSWRSLQDKFLLNFQGYRPDTDALAELSLCKQLEKETLREYYRKFLTLKSQLPSVDDQIAIHYAISGLRAGVLYSHCIRDPPKNLQELYQLFEKYARSKELHQRKVESQRKPKDPPQSSRSIVRRGRRHDGQVLHHCPRRPGPNLVHQADPAVYRLLEKSPGQISAQLPRVPPRHRRLG